MLISQKIIESHSFTIFFEIYLLQKNFMGINSISIIIINYFIIYFKFFYEFYIINFIFFYTILL